jgi:peptidoglycan/xylan/chitin deacetylase (PgdA/CDA1 family)
MNCYLTRRDFLRTSGAALILSALMPRNLFAGGFKIPVLLYHDISDQFRDGYTISPSIFAAQMEWLYSHDYRAISLSELNGLAGKSIDKAVIITFDDGYASFMDYAFPLLREYSFRATINVIGQYVGSFLHFGGNRPMLSWDEYRYLIESGVVDLGCYSYSLHVPGGVLQVSEKILKDDLRLFTEILEKETERNTDILAWPLGIYDRKRMRIAKEAGFKYLLTSREGYLSTDASLSEIPRLNINNRVEFASFKRLVGAP